PGALLRAAGGIVAHELTSLLRPDAAAPREDPRRSSADVVCRTTHHRRVAVVGERNRLALIRGSGCTCPHESALLRPHSRASREDPCCPDSKVVERSSLDGGVAVGSE